MSRFFLGVLALAIGGLVVGSASAQLAEPTVRVKKGFKAAQPATPAPTAVSDEEALKAAGIAPTDGAKLVGYLKQRTVSDGDQGKLQVLIKKFAADKFDERLAAADAVELFGPAAIGPLKAAEKGADAEIAYRATQVLKRMEKVPHASVAAAAVRAVVKLKPPEAAAALLGFLPLADSDALADDIRGALVALAVRDGKAEPALVAALADASPLRRTAAYVALIEGGPAAERIRIKDAFEAVKAAIRKDADAEAKFAGLWSLALTTREKEFVPDLIGLIPKLSRGRIWQVEELLLQLAGEHPPGGRFGRSEESLTKARDAWTAWWARKGAAIDLTKASFKPRLQGFTDLVMHDPSGGARGSIVTLGADLKEKSRIVAVNFRPHDARSTADGKFLVVEQIYSRIGEYDAASKLLKAHSLNQPVAAEGLPDGGRLYIGRTVIAQVDKDGGQTWSYTRPMINNNVAYDVLTGRRLPGGDTLFITNTVGAANCFRLDSKGKLVGKPLTLEHLQGVYYTCIEVLNDDTILVCESDRVAEYDLKTGKVGWKFAVNLPTSVQRLPNGNTLIAVMNQNKVLEIDPAGEVVWDYSPKDGLQILRAYRR